MTMRFFLYNHQHKGDAYQYAMMRAGYRLDKEKPDFIFIDHDVGRGGVGHRREVVDALAHGKKVFMYPHAARPMVFWDGIYEPVTEVSGSFVIAEGHKKVMEAYGYPLPTWVTGWTYGPIRKFRPANRIRTVLFAPIHPNGNGWLSDADKKINEDTFRAILALKNVAILVRYIGKLQSQGLWIEKNRPIRYIPGTKNCSQHGEIDYCDLTIAHQTHAYIAISRGKPVVMLGDRVTPTSGNSVDTFQEVKSYDKYKDLMSYPYDVSDGDLMDLMMKAAASESDILEWKSNFIGKPFDEGLFIKTLEDQL